MRLLTKLELIMKNYYLALVIIITLLFSISSNAANAQACENENSPHTLRILTYFLSDPRFEPDRIESGVQNLSIEDVTMLKVSHDSELCEQLRQTSLYLNAPDGLNDISFFKASNRRLIVYFFLDTLPNYEELIFYSGPIGLIRIFDENLNHVLSVSIK